MNENSSDDKKTPSLLSRACTRLALFEEAIRAPLVRRLTPGRAAVLLIGTSLLFAGAILAGAWFMGESEHQPTVTYGLIALWWIPFSLLSGASCEASGHAGDD